MSSPETGYYYDILQFTVMQFNDALSDDRAGNEDRASSANLRSDTTYTLIGLRAVYISEQ